MEAYADHSRRREEFVYRAPVGSLIPGLLFKLTLRGTFGTVRDAFVPDQPRRQLQAMALQRHAILLDQDHMAPIRRLLDREDHRGMDAARATHIPTSRSEEHTSELQSLMRISYAVFCLKKKKTNNNPNYCNRT